MNTVVVPERDWIEHNRLIAELFELHKALRIANAVILDGEPLDEEDRRHLEHVRRDFLPLIWTVE